MPSTLDQIRNALLGLANNFDGYSFSVDQIITKMNGDIFTVESLIRGSYTRVDQHIISDLGSAQEQVKQAREMLNTAASRARDYAAQL